MNRADRWERDPAESGRRDGVRRDARQWAARPEHAPDSLDELLALADCALVRLEPDWSALFDGVGRLGAVLLEIATGAAFLSKVTPLSTVTLGVWQSVRGRDLRLACDTTEWHWVFACPVATSGVAAGVYVFDFDGDLVLRIRPLDGPSRKGLDGLIRRQRAKGPIQFPARRGGGEDHEFPPLCRVWADLRSTEEAANLLASCGSAAERALCEMGTTLAREVVLGELQTLFETVVDARIHLAIQLWSKGVQACCTGPVDNIAGEKERLAMSGLDWKLYLDRAGLGGLWRVRVPTVSGVETVLVMLSRCGCLLAQIGGHASGGRGDTDGWRAVVQAMQPRQGCPK